MRATDEMHLAYAIAEGRVIVTQDTDFLRIVASGQSSAGVAFYPDQRRTIGQVIGALVLLWEAYDAGDMNNHVEFI